MPRPLASFALPPALLEGGSLALRGLRTSLRQPLARLRAGIGDPEAMRGRRLQDLLALNGSSAFGRQHGLRPGMGLDELRRAVPARTARELQPWLERVEQGEPGVLSGEPVRCLVETSGSTGRPKRLPVTASWARTVAELQAVWALALVAAFPAVAEGPTLAVVSGGSAGRSAGGLPIVHNSGRQYGAMAWPWRLRRLEPGWVQELPLPMRLRALLLLHLRAPVGALFSVHPSTLELLGRALREGGEELLADLRGGTARHGPLAELEEGRRRELELRLRLQPWRGALPRPPLDAARLWPRAVVACWSDGPAAGLARRLDHVLGGPLPRFPLGLSASEGSFSLPLDPRWPGGVLALWGHLIELLDETGESRPLEALEEGERLGLVVSTEAGLWRYAIEDQVEVVGRCGRAPLVRFIGKLGRYLNLRGERVSEEQIGLAAAALARDARLDLRALVACGREGEPPAYQVWVEPGEAGQDRPPPEAWAEVFDRALRQVNVEYEARRGSGRLGAPRIGLLPGGSQDRWRASRVAEGAPDAQLKPPWLAVDEAEERALLARMEVAWSWS